MLQHDVSQFDNILLANSCSKNVTNNSKIAQKYHRGAATLRNFSLPPFSLALCSLALFGPPFKILDPPLTCS